MNINRATIYGNITRDPEERKTTSGLTVVNFSVATNHKYKNKDGELVEEVEFHNIVAFNKTAESVMKYMKKGSGIFVEGRLKTEKWEDKETGKDRSKTVIIADRVQFGPKPQSGESREETFEEKMAMAEASEKKMGDDKHAAPVSW